MSGIELVIKLPEEVYKQFIKDQKQKYVSAMISTDIIANGIPLPKGHGRIGDLDRLIQTMKERNGDNGGEPLNAVDRGYDLAYQHMVKEAEECVIIEADKESEQ